MRFHSATSAFICAPQIVLKFDVLEEVRFKEYLSIAKEMHVVNLD